MRQGKRWVALIMAVGVSGLMAGCSGDAEAPQPAPLVGADRDEHGCIGSAGYAWCAKKSECVRPWELAEQAGFELSEAGFSEFCGNPLR